MKIKKIAWSVTESEYFSYTPLYQATVLKEVGVEGWWWRVRFGGGSSKTGRARTSLEAMNQCEEFWKSLLMGALEPVGKADK